MARALKGVTVRCIISFLDWYSPMERRFGSQRPQMIDEGQMQALAAAFGQMAAENGMRIFTCAETADLSGFGLEHGCCIDRELLEQIGGRSLDLGKDSVLFKANLTQWIKPINLHIRLIQSSFCHTFHIKHRNVIIHVFF